MSVVLKSNRGAIRENTENGSLGSWKKAEKHCLASCGSSGLVLVFGEVMDS